MFCWKTWVVAMFDDPHIDEVLINGCHGMQVLGEAPSWLPSPFTGDRELIEAMQSLAHGQQMRLDPLQPAAGGMLLAPMPGSMLHLRWHALLPPIARDGPLLSLRRHRLDQLGLQDFMSPAETEKLELHLRTDAPVFIMGPTGAGKTSLLVALLQRWAYEERVAILEQLAEIPRLSPYWIRVCAQEADLRGQGAFPLGWVFDELLRLRPDRLVIGELRREELVALKRSLLAGHRGVWCTLHASGPELLALRLADLSGETATFWDTLCREQSAVALVMQREKPRLREAWIALPSGWELIFSSTTGRAKPESF
jgi:pilus assembly protein CpaF